MSLTKYLGTAALGALLLVGAGCGAQTTIETQVETGASAGTTEAGEGTANGAGGSMEAGGTVEAGTQVTTDDAAMAADAGAGASAEMTGPKVINVTARQWSFDPAEIRVKKGESVRLIITSMDVTHGFSLPTFNVSATLQPNVATTVEFTPDKTGSYPFFCSIFCGNGHPNMRGTLIVE